MFYLNAWGIVFKATYLNVLNYKRERVFSSVTREILPKLGRGGHAEGPIANIKESLSARTLPVNTQWDGEGLRSSLVF